jgi:hypothetical protein
MKRLVGSVVVGLALVVIAACSDETSPPTSTPTSLPSPVQSVVSEAVAALCDNIDDLEATLASFDASPAPDPSEITAQLAQLSQDLGEDAQQLSAEGEEALASFATAAATAVDGLQAEIEASGSLSDEQQTAIDVVQFALQQLPPEACA